MQSVFKVYSIYQLAAMKPLYEYKNKLTDKYKFEC